LQITIGGAADAGDGGSASAAVSAPSLRALISLDLQDASLADALKAVSRQLGGRLMYDETTSSLPHRVTLRKHEISAALALREILRGTDVQVVPSEGGSLVLLKRGAPRTVVADSGTIRGKVVDAETKIPVPQVLVSVAGANRRATTNENGTFALPRIAPGEQTLQLRRIGYQSASVSVTLTPGQDTSIVVSLTAAPNVLSTVVSTGAGEVTKLQIGNTIAVANADSIMRATPVTTISQLLSNRLPGLLASTGSGSVGSPTRLRIRGLSSIESDNAPIVILDGVRISTGATTAVTNTLFAGVAGGNKQTGANDLSSRLDDLDPNSIESIEVLKGPAASTLYGSEAANGVIVIKTKRGQAGPPKWSFYGDYRTLRQVEDYDYPVKQVGYPLAGGAGLNPTCSVSDVYNGWCIPQEGSLVGFNMLKDPRFTPQARGYTRSTGGNVSGGNEGLQYFLGGSYLDQLGTSKLPDVNRTWIEYGRGGQQLAEEIIRPNARRNISADARITGRVGRTADFALGANFITQTQRVGADGMAGLLAGPRPQSDTTPVTTGWEQWYGRRSQSLKHVLGTATGNWRPTWRNNAFTANMTYGWDFSLNDDEYFAAKGSCNPLCEGTADQGLLGYINAGRRSDFIQTLNLGTQFNHPVASWLTTSTRLGGNFTKRTWYELYGNASNLGVGRRFYSASGSKFISDVGDERATAGWYLEEQLNLRQDRLFFTLGLRQDAGSAIGETVNPVYPKWNVSWLVSEEPFFPFKNQVSLFRTRFAMGNAGVMPASTARLRTYAMQSNFVLDDGSPTGSFAELGSPGSPELRAEHSKEYEGGFDLELFDRRLSLDLTWYHKYTWDAIHRGPLAGSVGPSVTRALIANLGDVENKGFELGSSLRVIDRDALSYTVTGNLTSRTNKLTRLADGVVTFTSLSASGDLYTGNDSRVAAGYPLFGRWAYPILGWDDSNGDGRIDPLEVMVGDSLAYVGPTEPKYTAYIGHQIGLLRNRVTIHANFAYSNGMTQFNQVRRDMAQYLAARPGMVTSLQDQACIAASNPIGQRRATDWCFMETFNLLRLQDVSIGYTLDPKAAQLFRASSASIRLTGTNLVHWSNYKGRDPGVNTTPVTGNAVIAGAAFGAPREYGVRVQLYY
jgi:TonB-dependent SusC/RagA subfamily outer membrane receptor